MKIGKTNILLAILCSFICLSANAVNSLVVESEEPVEASDANANFHFVYIDHEPTTPVGELCRRISKLRNDALETGDKVIIYLANEDQPMISFINLKDPVSEMKRDSIGFFDIIIDELQSMNYHEVNKTDLDTIKSIIGIDGTFPLFDEKGHDGQMNYKTVTIDFFIGKRFWALQYNEGIIGKLYESLRLAHYMKKYPITQLSFNIFKPESDQLIYSEGEPFGSLAEINDAIKNEMIKISEY